MLAGFFMGSPPWLKWISWRLHTRRIILERFRNRFVREFNFVLVGILQRAHDCCPPDELFFRWFDQIQNQGAFLILDCRNAPSITGPPPVPTARTSSNAHRCSTAFESLLIKYADPVMH